MDILSILGINAEQLQSSNVVLNQYLVVRLGDELVAIPMSQIREITALRAISSHLEANSEHFKTMTLRNKVVLLFDLKNFILNRKVFEPQVKSIICIVEAGERLIGAVVDEATAVVRIEDRQIASLKNSSDKRYCIGIAQHNNKNLTVIDLQQVISRVTESAF